MTKDSILCPKCAQSYDPLTTHVCRTSNPTLQAILRALETDDISPARYILASFHAEARDELKALLRPSETSERLPNLVDRLKRINAINDDPSRYNPEIDKLTECGKFIASDEYCELLIGHEGRCGLQPGSVRRAVEPSAGIVLYKCGKCGTPMRCGPTQWEYQCECNTAKARAPLRDSAAAFDLGVMPTERSDVCSCIWDFTKDPWVRVHTDPQCSTHGAAAVKASEPHDTDEESERRLADYVASRQPAKASEPIDFNLEPIGKCDKCGRKVWKADTLGKIDEMTQPDGSQCGGRFVAL